MLPDEAPQVAHSSLIDSYRFFYESSWHLAGFPKVYLFNYYATHWETGHCKYMSHKTIEFWAMGNNCGTHLDSNALLFLSGEFTKKFWKYHWRVNETDSFRAFY